MKDGRHTMRESNTMPVNEPDKIIRLIAARIDLPEAKHRCRIGKAPAMHMEHRRDWHIDIMGMKSIASCHWPECRQDAHRMQHQLAMRIGNAFRITGGAGGIETGGPQIFIKIRKGK